MGKLSGWRRIANAIWHAPNDPQIYGWMDIEATALLAFIEDARAAGHHLTATHVVGRAVARALEAVPDLNVRIRGSRAIPRDGIDIFFITAVSGGRDLSGVKVENVDALTAIDVASRLRDSAALLRAGRDRSFARTKRTMNALPRPLLKVALRTSVYLTEKLNVDVAPLGLKANPFGSAMVTSVGMFGLPQGFAPLAWMYDVPLMVMVGEITERALVVDHEVVARPVLPICATLDHRYVDGWHVSEAMKAFREYLLAPASQEPAAAALENGAAQLAPA